MAGRGNLEDLSRAELIEVVLSLQTEIARERSGCGFKDRLLARIVRLPHKPDPIIIRGIGIR